MSRSLVPHIFAAMDGITTAPATPSHDVVELVVNGGPVSVPGATSVAGLLERLGLDTRKVAVERNEAIVSRSTYGTVVLAPGDRVEIVHFIGGG